MRYAGLLVLLGCALAACDQSPTAPNAPSTTAPATASGNCWGRPASTSVRTLASKQAFWIYEQNYCTGYPGWVYAYQFRSDDAWICYTEMSEYYAYNEGDDAECEWFAG